MRTSGAKPRKSSPVPKDSTITIQLEASLFKYLPPGIEINFLRTNIERYGKNLIMDSDDNNTVLWNIERNSLWYLEHTSDLIRINLLYTDLDEFFTIWFRENRWLKLYIKDELIKETKYTEKIKLVYNERFKRYELVRPDGFHTIFGPLDHPVIWPQDPAESYDWGNGRVITIFPEDTLSQILKPTKEEVDIINNVI